MQNRALATILALAIAALAPAHAAYAQDDAARAEARERYQRALALFDEGNMDAALIEFEAAYQAVGNHVLLYNIGACHRALGHPVEAVEAWERYLRDGGDEIEPDRRVELEALLVEQRARIGTVRVTTNVYGARITLDGVTVGTAPLGAALRLGVGEYLIGAEMAGYQGPNQRITVAGRSEQEVAIQLDEVVQARASLRVSSPVPDVEVLVDGQPMGRTPLAEGTVPVTPGRRVVEGRRPGFHTTRETVDIEDGQELDVRLAMTIDEDAPDDGFGRVTLRIPDAPSELRVNGSEVSPRGGPLRLPAGAHVLRLAVDERQELRLTIELEAGATLTLAPELRWADDARARRLDVVSGVSLAGGLVLAIGGAAAVAGAVTGIYVESVDAARLEELRPAYETCTSTGMLCDRDMTNMANEYLDLEASLGNWRWVWGLAVGVGAAAAVVGVVILATVPSEEDIDRGARATLRLGPGGLIVDGQF